MLECYIPKDFRTSSRVLIRQANRIIDEFRADGFQLTLLGIALNMDQIRQYAPPPNPAKETDSRYRQYVARTGQTESWELDALNPRVIANLIRAEVTSIRDEDVWAESLARETANKADLQATYERWTEVKAFLAKEK